MKAFWFLIPMFILAGNSYLLIRHCYKIGEAEANEKNMAESDEPDKAYITLIIWFLRSIRFLLLICIACFFIWVI